jgi:aspartate aminotransferase
MRNEFTKRRDFLHSELNKIEGISCLKPNGAFYLFPNVSKLFHHKSKVYKIENSFDFAMHLLKETKTAVVPGSAFGAEGYLRVSYANSMENLGRAVERFKKAVEMLS